MKKTNKTVKSAVSKDVSVPKTPVELTNEFLIANKFIVFVSLNHVQKWRCVVVNELAKLLGVKMEPAVQKLESVKAALEKMATPKETK